jgi:hypothetical protein
MIEASVESHPSKNEEWATSQGFLEEALIAQTPIAEE